MSPRDCGGCGHRHGGRAFGVCLQVVAGELCPCVVVEEQLVEDLAPDPWVRTWRGTAEGSCDGCAAEHLPVMRVRRGPRVAMCLSCHATFIDAWRAADAASEAAELATDELLHTIAPEWVEPDEAPAVVALPRRAA